MGLKPNERNVTITLFKEDIGDIPSRKLFDDLVGLFKDLARTTPSNIFIAVLDKHPIAEKFIDAIDKRREKIGIA